MISKIKKASALYQMGATSIDGIKLMRMLYEERKYRNDHSRINREETVKFRKAQQVFEIQIRLQDIPIFVEIWMNNTYPLKRIVSKSIVCIDLGGHIGLFSLYAHYILPTASIHSIEGSASNYAYLKHNTRQIDNIAPHKCIVTKDGRKVNFNMDPKGYNHQISEGHDGELSESITMDEVLALAQLRENDHLIVKMDIEGAEKEILENNNQWLQYVDELYLELHKGYASDQLCNTLAKYGLYSKTIEQVHDEIWYFEKK